MTTLGSGSLPGIWDHCYDVVVHHYANFSGTATRREFWTFWMVRVLFGVILLIIPPIGLIFNLATIIPLLAIGARRLHERNLSGYWQLLNLVPVLGWIIVLILLVLPPKMGYNVV